MPRTADLEPLVTRVLAPNPSRHDPGRHEHLRRRRARAAARPCWSTPARTTPRTWPRWRRRSPPATPGASAVLVTHHHGDHAEAALPWGARFGAPVAAADAGGRRPGGRLLAPGERLRLAGHDDRRRRHPRAHRRPPRLPAGVRRRAGRRPRARPRHLGGDPSRGRRRGLPGVAAPGARPRARARSTAGTAPSSPRTRAPSWTSTWPTAPTASSSCSRRSPRGRARVDELVAQVYAAVPRALWPAAAQSTRATLAKLVAEDRVTLGADDTVVLVAGR